MAKKAQTRKYSKSSGSDVGSEMRRYKKGTAKSGKVGSRKQAIAIGLSKARKKGKKLPKNLCAFYICTQGCGRIVRPAFPAPSGFSEDVAGKNSGACARRDRGVTSLNVVARSNARNDDRQAV